MLSISVEEPQAEREGEHRDCQPQEIAAHTSDCEPEFSDVVSLNDVFTGKQKLIPDGCTSKVFI